KLISSAAAGGIASYMAGGASPKIGDPLVVYFVVIITIEAIKFVFRKNTPIDIIIIPLFVILLSGFITVLIDDPIMFITKTIGNFINTATDYQPFLMGIVIAVVMGMAL